METRTYKGRTIFSCEQLGIGPCDGKGWHVEVIHKPTGMPYSEQDCPKFRALKHAKEHITEQALMNEYSD